MSRRWTPVPAEDLLLASPIGLLLRDDFTGTTPIGPLDAALDLRDGGAWRPLDRRAVLTPSGVLLYPGLGRGEDLAQPARRYRVRLSLPLYRPLYRAALDGIEFDAPPYDDQNPPVPVTRRPVETILLPGPNYTFAPYIVVVRGVIEDAAGARVPDVLVQESLRERTLSDERGAFSLALRWVAANTQTPITATDQRTGRSGFINVTLPGAAARSQTITVS